MLAITGDLHGVMGAQKLFRLMYGSKASKISHLIILGDVGLMWQDTKEDRALVEDISSMPWKTLFIDGNHDNFDYLDSLPQVEMFGSPVGQVASNIFHLKRGNIYTIEDKTFFTFGGGYSFDKASRIPHVSWWPQELSSYQESSYGINVLEQAENKVDYVLTHTCPVEAFQYLQKTEKIEIYDDGPSPEDGLRNYLSFIMGTVQYKEWFFGHFHVDEKFDSFHCLYNSFVFLS